MDSEKAVFGNKLLDDRWLALEQKVIQSAEQFCQSCGKVSSGLHVHFFRYTTSEPWQEDPSNLTALCDRCHQMEHVARGAAERLLLDTLEHMSYLAVDVMELLPFVLANFQPRHARMSGDRLRRLELVREELSAMPEIDALAEQIRKLTEQVWSRVREGLSTVSEEYYDFQAQIKGLIEERRKLADRWILSHRSVAPPDEQTIAKLRPPKGRNLGD